MKKQPIWETKSLETEFPSLENNITVDIAIIGGGITGISTAQLLKQNGYKIAVFESHRVGKGTSGQSTGNLYALTEYSLGEIKEKYDEDVVKQITESRRTAFDLISSNIQQYNIDCDYHTRPMHIFENDESIDFEKELEIAENVGLLCSPLKGEEIPFQFNTGIKYREQAQFNPLYYVQHLARELHGENCTIYENTRILKIEEEDEDIVLETATAQIRATYVIHATHTPMGLQIQYHTTLGPYREYGIAAKLKDGAYPEGIFWGHYEDKKYSIRSYWVDNEPYLLCIGSMHKVGQAINNETHLIDLVAFVQEHFNLDRITHQWGGQNYKPADLLPYIGEKNTGSKQFIATGFSTDGLIYGVLAAMIIRDRIVGNENPYYDLYKASRHQPLKAAAKFAKENLNVAAQLVKDLAIPGFDDKEVEISEGEGMVFQVDGKKLAIHKDSLGNVTTLSAICPHMGCVVHWNNAEESWDCPCHGSRFDTSGNVIEGPAFHGLERKENKLDD